MAGETATYDLEGLAVPETINLLQDLLVRVGQEHPDVSAGDLMMFETAVVEIAANVVEHGTPPGEVLYRFRLDIHDDRLEGWLSDSGDALSGVAGALPSPGSPGSSAMPDPMSEQGRGLAMAERALDQLVYERCDERNTWRLVRRRN